jgi:hypothetical protein
LAAESNLYPIIAAIAGHGDLDSAIDSVGGMPEDAPIRGRLAAGLVAALLRSDLQRDAMSDHGRISRIDGLLAFADRNPPPGPEWRATRAVARAMGFVSSAAHGRLADPPAALAELDDLAADVRENPAHLVLVESTRNMIAYYQASTGGDESVYTRMPADVAKLHALAPNNPHTTAALDLFKSITDLMTARHRGDNLAEAIDVVTAKADQLPSNRLIQDALAQLRTTVTPFLSAVDGSPDGFSVSEEQLAAMRTLAGRPDIGDAQRAMVHSSLGGAMIGLGEEKDVDRITAGIDHFQAAVAVAGSSDRVFHLTSLGLALWRRSEITNSQDDVHSAAENLLAAKELAGGPQHPQWSFLNEILSQVKLRQGDVGARTAALDGLRNNAWKVLLQDDPAAAKFAARDAADAAVHAARLCIANSDPADAIRALDSGRSLMLFAATEFRDVVPRLVESGHHELAQRWQRAATSAEPDRLSIGLRHDVLAALSEKSDILDPPSLAEIRHALTTLDADALVYLVPTTSTGQPGWAVIAPADGPPSYLALPHLLVDDEYDVERYLSALSNRDLAPPSRQTRLVDSLEALCGWAWRAAVGPIVETYLPTLPTPATGRPYRLVLVPMGKLALIPWHAARRRDGRYAVADVAFSLAPSARLLCRSAALATVPPIPVGLVVGDPDTGDERQRLVAARIEAYAIHQAFYRGGRYVGTRADGSPSPAGTGTAEEVRRWLTDTRLSAGAMLHLACHGVTDTDSGDATSYLVLADGERLTAEEIVQLLAPAPERNIGLAVLAACRTGRSIHGYDEAYSLGTALLAGGVRTVLSTQWAIPDQATSLLMFMFHHYLMIDGQPAWAALRQAQLWMLDPDREPPKTMPAQLRRQLADADVSRVDAWAGFVHMGQ